MKRKLVLVFAFISILTSCTSNEDLGINITEDDLVGVWNFTSFTLDGSASYTVNGITYDIETSSYAKDLDYTVNFTKNPNEFSSAGSYTTVTTVRVSGEPDSVEEYRVDSLEGLDSGNWSLDGNTFKSINNGQETIAEIVEFTGSKLKLKLVLDELESISGVDATITGESFITLER